MKIIDPHLHLFDLMRGQYHWLKPDAAPHWPDKSIIARDFSTSDLALTTECQLAGFVHIEAGFNNSQPWQEIAWLEQTITQPFKSIASVDLTASQDKFNHTLGQLKQFSSVVGVRHILDQQASTLLKQPLVSKNLTRLVSNNLIFEAQLAGSDTQGVQALKGIALCHPQLTIIINHAGFCPSDHQQYLQWQHNIASLAQCPNIYIKASGWEMVDRQYSLSHVNNVLIFLSNHYDQDKIMLASNFPLCLFSKSYQQLWQRYCSLAVTPEQLNLLIYKNSHTIYRF